MLASKNLVSGLLIAIACQATSSLAKEDEDVGKIESISYLDRTFTVEDDKTRYRILYDAVIKKADGERASINQILPKSTVTYVYDTNSGAVRYISYRRPRK